MRPFKSWQSTWKNKTLFMFMLKSSVTIICSESGSSSSSRKGSSGSTKIAAKNIVAKKLPILFGVTRM